jgi:hypothetical protein
MVIRIEALYTTSLKFDAMSRAGIESVQTKPADFESETESARGDTRQTNSENAAISAVAWKGAARGRLSQRHATRPIAPDLQTALPRWFERRFPHTWQRALAFLGLLLAWGLAFSSFSNKSVPPVKVGGSYIPVHQLTCTDSFWLPDYACGINGDNCREDDGPVAFRCPANCGDVKLQKPYFVGDQTILNQPLVIGGSLYRADSWICAAAVHADVLDNAKGGCAALNRMGQTNSYPGSKLNGVVAIAVKTYFPQSYMFVYGSGFECELNDLKWLLPYISAIFTALVFLFSSTSTTSSAVSFATIFVVGVIYNTSSSADHDHTSLDTNPSPMSEEPVGSVSPLHLFLALSKYLLGLACAVLVFRRSVRRLFHKLAAPVEKTVLWLGGFWAMSLLLSSHGFAAEHEDLAATAAPLVLFGAALHHLHQLRREGRLDRPALLVPAYAAVLLAVLFSAVVLPPADAHRHHEAVLAFLLLLLPGAGMATRPNLLLQGLLVGLLVHGVAHHQQQQQQGTYYYYYDYAPQVATTTTTAGVEAPPIFMSSSRNPIAPPMLAADAVQPAYPEMLEPVIHIGDATSNISFTWKETDVSPPGAVNGISMLINDVERARWYFDGRRMGRGADGEDLEDGDTLGWARTPQAVVDYIRFSWLKGDAILGYGDAGVWEVYGEWKSGSSSGGGSVAGKRRAAVHW